MPPPPPPPPPYLLTQRDAPTDQSPEFKEFLKGSVEPGTPGLVMPRVQHQVEPRYTSDAMRAKIQGTVIVHAIVLPDGTVDRALATSAKFTGNSIGETMNEVMDSAMAAAKAWTFTPGTLKGQPVAVHVQFVLEFRLH